MSKNMRISINLYFTMGEVKETILLVENDRNAICLIQTSFELANIPVSFQVVKKPLEAIDYLSDKEPYTNRERYPLPAVILTEINMPCRVSGFELLTWVKQHPNLKNIPVVVMSTSDDPDQVVQAASLGADSYFIKMLPFDDLVDIVAKLVF